MQSTTIDASTLEACISAAVAAPSIFNTQPWHYRLDPETVTLQVRAAPERGLRHVDPTGRALHMSVGAAVLNLRVAVAHFGWCPVTRLLPLPENPELLATVRLAAPAARSATGHRTDLYAAIRRRHSSRLPFSGRPLPSQVRSELIEAAHMEGARLTFPTAEDTTRLLRLTAEAERRNRNDPDRRDESRRWIRHDADGRAGVGLPQATLGPQDARERVPLRDFTAERHPERLPSQPFEPEPVVAVLGTQHDRRADWMRAGQALEHVLLVATVHDVRASLLHQAVEWPDLRPTLNGSASVAGHVQILVRLGYGPEGVVTPRRAVDQVFDPGGPDR
ncbi:Acg family FMN-binding oxidoreductase [Streptomyces sp. HD]|uniref:Acg family FMN-binding oxidoreductase n=1 Tax=Streptomyces sp. HD TaxID=3020892 RepID=UPI00232A93B4|nr:hypothetical protein [Streptomyces sp. HD]MDC0765391.1 hypothetical protein [Streptomyces sp. HD]